MSEYEHQRVPRLIVSSWADFPLDSRGVLDAGEVRVLSLNFSPLLDQIRAKSPLNERIVPGDGTTAFLLFSGGYGYYGAGQKCSPGRRLKIYVQAPYDPAQVLRDYIAALSSPGSGAGRPGAIRALAQIVPSLPHISFTGIDIDFWSDGDVSDAQERALELCERWLIKQAESSREYREHDCGSCTVDIAWLWKKTKKCEKTIHIIGAPPCKVIAIVRGDLAAVTVLFQSGLVEFEIRCEC